MSTFLFLSSEWISAADSLRTEFEGRFPPPPVSVRMNLVVNKAPADVHESGEVTGHIDTAGGQFLLAESHLDDPEMTITTDYETAKAAFVDQDPQAVMTAFMGGKILVEGDASKLLALQGQISDNSSGSEEAKEMYERLRAFTRD